MSKLVICEKPSVAQSIGKVLGASKRCDACAASLAFFRFRAARLIASFSASVFLTFGFGGSGRPFFSIRSANLAQNRSRNYPRSCSVWSAPIIRSMGRCPLIRSWISWQKWPSGSCCCSCAASLAFFRFRAARLIASFSASVFFTLGFGALGRTGVGGADMCRYTEQELRDIFYDALDFFNEALDSGITRDNTVLAFFTPENGLDVYEQFCREHFPKNLDEDYKAEGPVPSPPR